MMAAWLRRGSAVLASSICSSSHGICIRRLSYLVLQQSRSQGLLGHSQLSCLVCVPHHRQEMTFSKKRRRLLPHHDKDGVSPDMEVVYENNMNRLNFWGQLVINVMAVPIYGMSFKILISSWPFQDLSIASGPPTAMAYILLYSVFLFGVNGLCRRSIRRIYADTDAVNFAAVVQDWKMMPQTVHFDLSSVAKKTPGTVWGTFFGNLNIKGRSYLTSPTDYAQPKFYNLLMGYDLERSVDLDRITDIDIKDIIRSQEQQSRKGRLQKGHKKMKS